MLSMESYGVPWVLGCQQRGARVPVRAQIAREVPGGVPGCQRVGGRRYRHRLRRS